MRQPQPLQKFGYKDSPYERPNQKWICGKQTQGCPCEIGPDENGKCRADFECKPKGNSEKKHWTCTRSRAFGGNCTDGPLPDGTCCKPITPCYPARSIRYKRTLTIRWVSIVTLGILLFFIYGSNKQNFLSPGKLNFQHANNAECSDCHEVFDKGVAGWIHQGLNSVNIIDNNKQCLNCHEFDEFAADAHSLSSTELKKVSYAMESEQDGSGSQQIACMTCHVEHHGSHNSLLAISSQNCALCHDLPFENGSTVHPEFLQYPYRHRTGIIFDHNQHYGKHFFDKSGENLKENAPKSCLTCHISDKNGIKMVVRDFQKTCSDCHSDVFEESEVFPVITVPGLDTENLTLIGNWPADSEAELTPFMKLLLSSDDKASAVLVNLEGGELYDLEKKNAELLVLSIKELFYDITLNGKAAISQRLSSAFHCQLNPQGKLIQEPACHLTEKKLEALVNVFPYTEFCSAQKQWFPRLVWEMSTYHRFQGIASDTSNPFCNASMMELSGSTGTSEAWLLEADYFTLSYRPTSHDDEFFSAWLNTSGNYQGEGEREKALKEIFTLLNSEDSAGQCVKCHSVNSNETGNQSIYWSMPKWNPKRKDFIRFNHAGHLLHQEESICLDCHQKNQEADYLASYKNNTPLDFQSNFTTEKEQCQTCHQQAMTKTQCQTCHNYHVTGTSERALLTPELMGQGNLKVWTDKADYVIGENIVIKFSVDHAMYVRIMRIDSSGKILSLFPNVFRPEHYCKPGVVYQIPKLGSGRVLTIGKPAGKEKILGVGSENPIAENDLFYTSQGVFDEEKMSQYTIFSDLRLDIHE